MRHPVFSMFAAFAFLFGQSAALAAPDASDGASEMSRIADQAFAMIDAGKSEQAIKESLGRSPLGAGRTADIEVLSTQIDNAIKIYGPIRGHEKISEVRIGTKLLRRYYLVQHEKMLTRWEFDLAKLPSGWEVLYVGFEDKVQSWEP